MTSGAHTKATTPSLGEFPGPLVMSDALSHTLQEAHALMILRGPNLVFQVRVINVQGRLAFSLGPSCNLRVSGIISLVSLQPT